MSTAAIHLRTGLPGAGKTLLTLDEVHRLQQAEGDAKVYYSGIADLRVPGWIELEDATQWHTLPAKSIVIIDEAQRVFRPRHTASQVPEHVARLETIRHQGIRLFVVTQHPKLIDPNLRRLVGNHRHYVRVMGSKVISSHEWAECYDDPDKSRTDSLRSTVTHPKHVYQWYKSAEVHTVQRRIPLRVIFMFLIPLLVAGAIYGAYSIMSGRFAKDRIAKEVLGAEKAGAVAAPARAGPLNAAEWVALQSPRIPGLAYTAPVYDGLTAPKVVPHPAMCLASATRCSCYTMQATILDIEDAFCRQIVERGFFVPWQEDKPRDGGTPSGGPPARTMERSPLQAQPPRPVVAGA